MNANCNDRDRILEDGTPAEWAALEAHAVVCAACAEELSAWKSLSVAAAELRDYADSPALWPRIQQALAEGSSDAKQSAMPWSWRSFWQSASVSWQTATASALVVVLAFSGGWFYLHRAPVSQPSDFLKSKALVDVERAESAYVQAIDKLGTEA